MRAEVDYRKPHVFDPIHNGASECRCGLTFDSDIHRGETVSNEVKQEDKEPERVWLTVFTDDQDPRFVMMEWQSPAVRNTQPGDFVATRPHHKIAYVPESLLATVRREVWNEAIRVAQVSAKKSQVAGLNIAAAEILIRRLERASTNQKGEING